MNIIYLLTELSGPLIMLLVSLTLWKNPPKMNESIGYRTKRSQLSEEAWNFAQVYWGKISTITFAVFTGATVVVGLIGILRNFGDGLGFTVCMIQAAVLVILLFVNIGIVENKLKLLFDENGKPRE